MLIGGRMDACPFNICKKQTIKKLVKESKMKKRLVAFLVLALVMVLALASCDPIGDFINQLKQPDEEYVVYFIAGEGTRVPSQTVKEGELVKEPETPVKTGYEFHGWYKDEALTTPWNFASDTITQNTMIYAKWILHVHVGGTATCTSGPICESCGEEYGEALGHKGGAATCTEAAVCEVCGESYGDPLGHKGTGATCTEDAVCEVCGVTYEEATGHTEEVLAAVAPTCTEDGLTEGKKCSTCGEILVAQETVPATGHAWGEWITDTDPTQDTDGTKHRECGTCGETETGTIPSLGHTHSHTSEVTTPATCEADGVRTYTCSCGDSYTEVIPATGHTEGEAVVENEVKPNCTTAGSYDTVVYCTACDKELSRETTNVDALGHKDEDGDFKCDTCDAIVEPEADSVLTIEEAMALASLFGHDKYTQNKYYIVCEIVNVYNTTYGNFNLKDTDFVIYGLYSADGKTRYDAMTYKPVAGDEITVYGVIGKYNTTLQMKNAWLDDVVAHEHVWSDATCKALATCSICGSTTGELADHDYVDGTCSVCGKVEGAVVTEVRFEFGANGKAEHADGADSTEDKTYTETLDGYTLTVTSTAKMYIGGRDAKGNSCLKFGTSSKTGNMSFTVPEDVVKVVIYVSGYKATTTTNIKVNGTAYTVKTASNNGEYTAIEIDTTTTKTVTFETVTYRAMVNSIVYVLGETEPECEHQGGHATCLEKAVCDLCGESYGELADHDYDAVVTDPDCVNGGYTTYTCSVCEDSYVGDETDALGHTSVVDEAVAPTCTETGLTEGSHCDVCGEVLVAQEEVPALGHAWGEWVEDVPATEEADGTKHRTCGTCGEVEDGVIPSLEHVHNYTTVVTQPTCTEGGYTTYTCKCGDTYTDDETDALGHTEGETVVENEVDPTCTVAGSYESVVYCSVCNAELSRTEVPVDALGHTPVVDEAVDPTCEGTGLTEGSHCDVCGETLVAQEEVPALGHVWNDGEVTKPATYGHTGTMKYTCATDSTHTKTETIAKLVLAADATPAEIVDAAYSLAKDESLTGTFTLTGIITSVDEVYSTQYKNITVTIKVDGAEATKLMKCYRLKGTGADAIGVGDTITVTGKIKNYNGTVEFDANCTLDSYTIHEHTFTEATCEAKATCSLCGITEGDFADHVYENGVCKVCGLAEGVETTTVTYTASAQGYANAQEVKSITLDANASVAIVSGGGQNSTKYYNTGYALRVYPKNKFTFSVAEGCTIISIKITSPSGYTITSSKAVLTNATGEYDGTVVTLTPVDGSQDVTFQFAPTATSGQCRISSIEVVYASAATEPECEHKGGHATCLEKAVCELCGESYGELGDHDYDAVVTDPDCVNGGYTTYTCSVCEDSYVGDETDALGHTSVVDEAVAPTCTETGLTEGSHCDVCGEVLVAQETVDALGHRLENWIQLDPTCTEAGYTAHQRCSREGCGYTSLYFELAPKGHTVVVDEAVEVTCTTDGKTEGSHCDVCGEVLVAQETITALGHDLENHDAKAPTYSEAGWEAYESCKREGCGYSTKVELAYVVYLEPSAEWVQNGARFAIYFFGGNGTPWVDMSDEDGDGVYEAEIIYGHTNLIFVCMNSNTANNWDNKVAQTADLALSDAGNCYRVVDTTGRWYNYPCAHEYSEVTCTEDAVCGICGHIGTVAPGHTWAEEVWTVVTAPTTEADGVKSRECSVCGTVTDAILRQAEVKPMLYLTPNSNWKVDNARFAAYFFGNGEKWVSMTYNSELKVYEVEAPAGYPNVIFCRMNPGTTANNWNNKWNQTADLKVPADGTNHYTVKANTWDNGGGTWSTVTVTVEHEHVYYPATCTTVQTCYQCDATYGELADHNYGEWIVVVPSTCKETGTLGHYACSVCQKNFDADKNELESLVIDIDPDAHFDGEDENNNCDYCNASLCTEHTWNEGEVVTEATCETAGSNKFTCTACGTTETRVTEALGHDYSADWTVDVPATCTEVGSQSHHCSRCDSKSDVTEIPATGHSYNKTVVTPATCTEDGYITITCRNCEKSFVSGVDAEADQYLIDFPFFNIGKKGHTEGEVVVENATSPDCVNNGSHEDVVYCTVCEVELSRTLVTDEALGHTNGDPVKEKEVAPDCENTGSYESVVYCTVCNAELSRETVTVNARGHYLVRADGKAATCTEDGYTEYKYCADCDYTEGKEVIPAGHKIVEVEAKAATCTEDGYTAYEYCENCDYVYGKEVIPAGHKLVDVEAKAATCTDDGYTAHKACENCDYTEGKEVVDAFGHEWNEGEVTKPATYGHAGTMTYTCATDSTHTKTETIAKLVLAEDATPAEIVDAAYSLAKDESLTNKQTLTGVITSVDEAYSTQYSNIVVTIRVDGADETKLIKCYRMKGTGADKIGVGDTITVTGTIKNYNGTIEFDSGCTLDSYTIHEHTFTEATCETKATCSLCGITDGDFADHVYENGVCKVCGLSDPSSSGFIETLTSVTLKYSGTTTTNMTSGNQASKVGLDGTIFTVTAVQGKASNNIGLNKAGTIRLYYNASGSNELVVTSTETITSIKVSAVSGYNKYGIYVDGVKITGTTSGVYDVYDINAKSFTVKNENTSNVQVHISSIEITYKKITCVEHTWDDGVVTKSATCTTVGETLYTCTVCNETRTEEIPTIAHNIVTDAAVPATCQNTGKTEGSHCESCGEIYVAQETLPVIECIYENGVCIMCGVAESHVCTPAEAVKENVVEATCEEDGSYDMVVYCSDANCGEKLSTEHFTVDAIGHSYADGKCTNCGEKDPDAAPVEATDTMTIYANKGTTGTNTISWTSTSGNVTFTNNKASSSTAIRTSDSDHYRVYANSQVVISGNDGATITKVVITCSSSSYATTLKTSLTNAGYTATVSGSVVTVTVDSVDNITFTASAQIRLKQVVVTYLK